MSPAALDPVRRFGRRLARRLSGCLLQADVELQPLLLDTDQVGVRLQEGAKLLEAVVGLVERRVQAQHDLFQAAGEDRDLALLLGADQRAAQQVARVGQLQLVGDVVQLLGDQRLVEDELVAGAAQQVAGRRAQADADRVLAVVAQLVDQLGEVAVAGDDRVDVDVRPGEDGLHRVDGQPHIGAILLLHADGVELKQVDAVLQHRPAVAVKASPVAVGPLDQQPAARAQQVHHRRDVEIPEVRLCRGGHVFEIHKDRNLRAV